jgi:DNA polymerase III subunit delta'
MKPWPIVGHHWAVQQLRHAIASADEASGTLLPQALLITGPESVGKHTLARQVVAAMLCRADGDKPCGACLSCRKLRSGNHPDFLEVAAEDRAARVKIDQVRDVERFLALTPKESLSKVALICDFERATINAANALLKTLEEPPSYAHIILLATDADLLLPTVVSRTQHFPLRPLSTREVAEALATMWQVDEETAARLARFSGGRIGWAVHAIESPEALDRMRAAVETLVAALQQDLPGRFETAQALAGDAVALNETLETWLTFWRDVLLLQADMDGALVTTEHRGSARAIAGQLSITETAGVLTTLEQAQVALAANANTQLWVENLLLALPDLGSAP